MVIVGVSALNFNSTGVQFGRALKKKKKKQNSKSISIFTFRLVKVYKVSFPWII